VLEIPNERKARKRYHPATLQPSSLPNQIFSTKREKLPTKKIWNERIKPRIFGPMKEINVTHQAMGHAKRIANKPLLSPSPYVFPGTVEICPAMRPHDMVDTMRRHGVSVKSLPEDWVVTHARFRRMVIPRQICMAIMYNVTKLSYKDVGRLFNRDHATVIYAINEVKAWLGMPKHYQSEIQLIKEFCLVVGIEPSLVFGKLAKTFKQAKIDSLKIREI
jgi:hypothetical protein